MPVVDTFSKRQKRERGDTIEVFSYDTINPKLRVQIVTIWKEALGRSDAGGTHGAPNPAYRILHETLATEFGVFSFRKRQESDQTALIDFFVNGADTEQALDMIDLSFRVMFREHQWDKAWASLYRISRSSSEAIADLNRRFLEHGIGYAFVESNEPRLIRKDSECLHQETMLPALRLLHEEGFSGANDEYMAAHEHYRHGNHKDCLTNCLKAFESTMKTICTKRKWAYNEGDTASTLIDTCLKNGLLPAFMQAHLGTVKSALVTAIPTVRNKMGGHGQGPEPKEVPQFYAEHLLHKTAASIVFLVDAYRNVKQQDQNVRS